MAVCHCLLRKDLASISDPSGTPSPPLGLGVTPLASPIRCAPRAVSPSRSLRDDLVRCQAFDLTPAEPQPALEHLGRMLTQHGRRPYSHGRAVVPDWPSRHDITIDLRMVHGLQDAALVERAVLGQLLSIEHGPCRDASGTNDPHCLVLVVLARPRRHDGVDLLFTLGAVGRCLIALVADQILTPDQL